MDPREIQRAAKEYVQRHMDSKEYSPEKMALCCRTVSPHMVHVHQRGFVHFTISRNIKLVEFRTAVQDELRARKLREEMQIVQRVG